MNEKRRLPRKRPDVALQVTDAMTGDVVGRLGNLSLEGMMLIAHAPIIEDGLYQFVFHLPDAHGRLHPLEVGVHEQWSEASNVRGHHWIGFRFIDITAEDQRVLRDWLMHAEEFQG
ncbi:PilZ domain-containing protein [Dokdonella soli]|uniref:PilZ domain-containing protein n=1 Tax=Dokdonella soli TaxID=529810 RepID=A0ABP3TVR8_9GAMM